MYSKENDNLDAIKVKNFEAGWGTHCLECQQLVGGGRKNKSFRPALATE